MKRQIMIVGMMMLLMVASVSAATDWGVTNNYDITSGVFSNPSNMFDIDDNTYGYSADEGITFEIYAYPEVDESILSGILHVKYEYVDTFFDSGVWVGCYDQNSNGQAIFSGLEDLTLDAEYSIPTGCIIRGQNTGIMSFYIYGSTGIGTSQFRIYEFSIEYEYVSNTAPVINSITPSERTELILGECQTYSANVTDDEDDANYTWTLGGVEVSTSETYQACWDDIAAGIYTLQLEVADAEYSDTASVTLEIRARGGSPTGRVIVETVEEEPVVEEDEGKIQPQQQPAFTRIVNNITDYFVGLWQRVFG